MSSIQRDPNIEAIRKYAKSTACFHDSPTCQKDGLLVPNKHFSSIDALFTYLIAHLFGVAAIHKIIEEVSLDWPTAVRSMYHYCYNLCQKYFHKQKIITDTVEDEEKYRDRTVESFSTDDCLAILYAVEAFTPADFEKQILKNNVNAPQYIRYLMLVSICLNVNNRKYVTYIFPNGNLQKNEIFDEKVSVVRKVLARELKKALVEDRTVAGKTFSYWLTKCCYHLSDMELTRYFNSKLKARNLFLPTKELSDTDHDGVIYDRARDPPGQRSYYIPPGDTNSESYRLSTYVKFPQDAAVNPRHLAASGFHYTGYKDRVKCFCCGLCVEGWQTGDDVRQARWHRIDCAFMNGDDHSNIPMAGYQFGKRRGSGRNPSPNTSTSSRPVASNQPTQNNIAVAGTAQTISPSQDQMVVDEPASARPIFNPRFEFASITNPYHETFIRSLDMRRESERLRSYEHWPTGPNAPRTVDIHDLARSGFFYLGNLDRVQCFSCGGVLRNWNFGDNVMNEHRRHFPQCKMTSDTERSNVPLEPSSVEPPPPVVFQEPPDPSHTELTDLVNMFPCRHPISPHMRHEAARLETFNHRWIAHSVRATPQQIASAGFFFLGERDRVKCWYCNGGLQNWEYEDEPWTEHAKWFPTCAYLLQKKGPDFVHRMVSMFPNLPRPVLRTPAAAYDVPPRAPLQRAPAVRAPPSPPPPIIDPRAVAQRERERIRVIMNSDIVSQAREMGFDDTIIRRAVKLRLRESSEYRSVAELVDDITNGGLRDMSDTDDDDEVTTPNSVAVTPTEINPPATSGESGISLSTSSMDVTPAEEPSEPASSDTPPTVSKPPLSMEERIRELQDERKCKICLDSVADIVFVPCGHLCCCANCAGALRKCPMCRKKIEKAIRTYIS